MWMNRLLGLVLLMHSSAALAGEPLPAPVDVTPYAKSLTVFHDGKGHYFVVHRPLTKLAEAAERLFYGDGKRFFRQPVPSRGRNGEDVSFSITEPRVAGGAYSSFERTKGKVSFRCENRITPLVELEAKQAEALIKAAKFYEVYFTRTPYVLARDLTGRYFYVDRVLMTGYNTGAFRAGDFRVYVGMRGKMKPLKMKNIVSDASGEIFITLDGQLRLIVNKVQDQSTRAAQWIVRGKKTELTLVDVNNYRTSILIFRDLGPYIGQRLELPCDDF